MSNVPKLRFKEFSGEWEEKKFEDIYDFFQTNSFSRALLNYENGEVKNIHYGDIHTKFKSNFYIQNEEVPYINTDTDISKIKNENYCQAKDLVIADASEDYKDIGKAIEVIDLNNEKLLAGLHTYIARDTKDKMALGFGGYFMQTHNVRMQMMKLATGISVLGISKGNLSKMDLIIPQKQEQEKIASFLTSVDTKIEQLTKKEELLQKYKKGVMQKIFNQEIRFKADDGSEFPEWGKKKLKDIATKKNAKNKGSKIKVVLTNSAEFGIINQQDYFDKDIANQNNLEGYYIVEEGDFVYNPRISLLAPVGPMKRNKIGQGVMSPLYTVLEMQKEYRDFYELYFNTALWHKYMNQIANFGARHDRMNVTNNDFMKMPLPFPCVEEQKKVVSFLSAITQKVEQSQNQLKQTKEFKKALLQQMFV